MDAALRSLIDWYDRAGVDVPALAPVKPARKKRPNMRPNVQSQTPRKAAPKAPIKPQSSAPSAPAPETGIADLIAAATQAARKAQDLDALQKAVQNFDAGRLSDKARGAVFARGNSSAKLMVIGEAPSGEDDMKGLPFMGREGELLSKMLGAIGLSEDDYYLTLAVNWRTAQNLPPKPDEIDICRPFLRRHIELAAPKHILMLGSTPMHALTDAASIMKHHGEWLTVKVGEQDIPALPIYNPSLLLKQAELKKDAWRDLLTLRAALNA